ncbi:MADS-box transcription factor 27-like [Pyrus ussuriensis x Pyrus communis]|uniref:MADS-box transcription factor 27-like n=1 Tax=Pyrus ussuriensis x Pyrus communis TaxID=2448454 RepID=A0A5N5GMA3_9ROSA|nr:MADS-box transcription factor 27-like [Pyrus ussuriensis x Pyrus communis]
MLWLSWSYHDTLGFNALHFFVKCLCHQRGCSMRLTSAWFLIVCMIRLQVAHMEHRVKLETGWEFHDISGFANLLDDREWSLIFPQQALVQATSTLVLRRIKLHKDLVAGLELHIPSLTIRPFLHLL